MVYSFVQSSVWYSNSLKRCDAWSLEFLCDIFCFRSVVDGVLIAVLRGGFRGVRRELNGFLDGCVCDGMCRTVAYAAVFCVSVFFRDRITACASDTSSGTGRPGPQG